MAASDDEVVGIYRSDEEPEEQAPTQHSHRFDIAFERALDEAGRRWGNGEHPRVTVRHEVKIIVWNPAEVGEYRVILTP